MLLTEVMTRHLVVMLTMLEAVTSEGGIPRTGMRMKEVTGVEVMQLEHRTWNCGYLSFKSQQMNPTSPKSGPSSQGADNVNDEQTETCKAVTTDDNAINIVKNELKDLEQLLRKTAAIYQIDM